MDSRAFRAPKVPEVFVLFWVVKLLTTGIGEAGSDYLAKTNLLLAAAVGVFGFWFAMRAQLRADHYHPVRYWIAVLMVAIFGTMCADGPHLILGTPYWFDSAVCAAALGGLFVWWQRSEGTLSVHSITTARRERFYWTAVLLTFGLGTALGDTTAFNFHLGYSWSTLLFGVAILIPLALWRTGVLTGVAAFWGSYVLTRPLGASIADWLGKPADKHGLGFGDGIVFALGLVVFALLVAYLTRTHSDVEGAHAGAHRHLAAPADDLDPA
ncbi:MAG: hypothetical protein JWR52_1180 [Marmoricola sp.]|nr:hypothetical protein [Marmoricola sp.]